MLSRAILRSLRPTSVAPRIVPKAPQPLGQQFASPLRRFQSEFRRFPPPPPRKKPGRKIYNRWDPEDFKNAEPLIRTERIVHVAKHRITYTLMGLGLCGGTVFYFTHIEEVPVSGRRRFMCYSEGKVENEGMTLYRQIMQQNANAILPVWDKRVRMVNRVMEKLIPASGLEHVNWEVHVIDSPEANAFVIPGGKVFVYSGIIPIAKTDDGLAAIIGHEIAHNLARHPAEQLSKAVFFMVPLEIAIFIFDVTSGLQGIGRFFGNLLLDFGISRPASRVQESEADYIGLMMMAKSCYDPKEAVQVWERMQTADRHNIPQWMSTHPSNSSRISKMTEWLPKAEQARSEGGCSVTLGYQKEFGDLWGKQFDFFR